MAKALPKNKFMTHDRSEAGRSNIARGWVSRTPPRIDILLHKEASVFSVWIHQFNRVVERTRDEARTVEVWSYPFNCHEEEDVLKHLLRRRDSADRPENPPVICPACILTETVREMVNGKKIRAKERIFQWQGDDPTKARVYTAGGVAKMFTEDMSDVMRVEMRAAGLTERIAWRQSLYAGSHYAMVRADVDHLDEGMKIAIERGIVGDKIRAAARDRQVSKGEEEGDIWVNPCVIRLENFPQAKAFWDRYKATMIEKIEVTEEMAALASGSFPDIERAVAPGDVHKLRAELEAHCLVELPWDEIFGPAEEKFGKEFGDPPGTGEEAPVSVSGPAPEKEEPKPTPKKETKPKAPPPPTRTPEETCECDVCGAEMSMASDRCPGCGVRYDLKTGELINEEPKPKRKRSEMAKGNGEAKPAKKQQTPKKPPEPAKAASRTPEPPEEDDNPFADEGDELPWGKGG